LPLLDYYSLFSYFSSPLPPPPSSTLFPYTTLFRSQRHAIVSVNGSGPVGQRHTQYPQRNDIQRQHLEHRPGAAYHPIEDEVQTEDRKSTRLNSSHVSISYAVFCLKKKTRQTKHKNT